MEASTLSGERLVERFLAAAPLLRDRYEVVGPRVPAETPTSPTDQSLTNNRWQHT